MLRLYSEANSEDVSRVHDPLDAFAAFRAETTRLALLFSIADSSIYTSSRTFAYRIMHEQRKILFVPTPRFHRHGRFAVL